MGLVQDLAAFGARGRVRVLPVAVVAALSAGTTFAIPLLSPLPWLALAALSTGGLLFAGHRSGFRSDALAWIALALAFGAAGTVQRARADAFLLEPRSYGRGWLIGRVEGLPESGAYGPRFVLRVERTSLRVRQGARLSCTTRGARPPADGALVRALAEVEGPLGETNPGGFDARAWSRVAGFAGRARLVPGTLQGLAPASPWSLGATWISPLRARLLEAIAEQERGRAGAFLAGFLLGDRSRLDAGANDDLRRAGALHLLAISGMHVALAIALIGRGVALAGLRGRRAALVRLAAALLYSALAGGSASVWRAGATAFAVEAGALMGRKVAGEQGLGLALLLLVALRPSFALDAGFQLSVLATWGLLAIALPVQRAALQRLEAAPRAARIALDRALGAIVPTLGAQLAALPCMAASFGAISALGLLSNLVLVPMTDLALVTGLLALASHLALPPLAPFFWITADGAALLTLRGAAQFARLPAALRPLGDAPWAILALSLSLLALLAWRAGFAGRGGVAVLALAAAVGGAGLVGILHPARARHSGAFEWTLFDVGQGDGMLLRFPDGKSLLVDAGMADLAFDQGARVVVPALRARGVGALHAVLATHRDLDHLGGLPAVVRDVPCAWAAGPGDVPGRILAPVRMRGGAAGAARPFVVQSGQRLLEGSDYRVTCLWPPPGFRADPRWTPNRESVVLLVELIAADTLRILLMGDADTVVEREVVARGVPRCDLLKIGHHGSRTSSGEAFLDAVRPGVALVSVGRVNRFGHPHPDVRARFARRGIGWRSTGEEGALDVVAQRSGGHWRVSIDPARGARPIALARRRGAG